MSLVWINLELGDNDDKSLGCWRWLTLYRALMVTGIIARPLIIKYIVINMFSVIEVSKFES